MLPTKSPTLLSAEAKKDTREALFPAHASLSPNTLHGLNRARRDAHYIELFIFLLLG
jgi:hypothetical protein